MPTYPIISEVNYSFDGGKDLLSFFNLTVSYINSDKKVVFEQISSLPWQFSQKVHTPFDAQFDVLFSVKDGDVPEALFYKMGFDGDITYNNSYGYINSLDTKNSENKEMISFRICFENIEEAEKATLSIPTLKYDKHFAFSYTADDAVVGAYARFWRRVNKKWIDDIEFFHKHCTPTTGYQPENTLGMTDGCNNERRFQASVAIWPNVHNEYQPNGFMEESTSSTQMPYITWDEVATIVDFGGSVCYHNVDEIKYDNSNPEQIVSGIEEDRIKTLNKIGRSMKIMSLPDGNRAYLEASKLIPSITMIRTDIDASLISLQETKSLYKKHLYNGFSEDKEKILQEMEEQNNSSIPYWMSYSTHQLDDTIIPFFEKINKTYGKEGKDNIWFATIDEIYEYITMREGAVINKFIEGNDVVFEITLPTNYDFYYKDMSFILNSSSNCTLEPVSNNIVGLFSNNHSNNTLINVNFNKHYVEMAEKYTSIYEKTLLEEDKDDAIYFTSFLSPSIASPFLERINKTSNTIILSSIIINNGEETSYFREISITMSYFNHPTHYKIWEGNNENSSEWIPFTSDTVSYTLSESFDKKKISVRLKNEFSESEIVSASILLLQLDKNTIPADKIQEYVQQHDGYTFTKSVTIPSNISSKNTIE